MKILVINCGSSSIKYKLYEMDGKKVLASGGIEKIGLEGAFLKAKMPDGSSKVIEADVPDHTVGIKLMFDTLLHPEYGAIKSLDEIGAPATASCTAAYSPRASSSPPKSSRNGSSTWTWHPCTAPPT